MALRDQLDPQGRPDSKEPQATKVRKVRPAQPAPRGLQARLGLRVAKVRRESPVQLDLQVRWGSKARPALRARLGLLGLPDQPDPQGLPVLQEPRVLLPPSLVHPGLQGLQGLQDQLALQALVAQLVLQGPLLTWSVRLAQRARMD